MVNPLNRIKHKIQETYDATIDFVDEHIYGVASVVTFALVGTFTAVLIASVDSHNNELERVDNTQIVYESEQYDYNDVYAVYDADSSHFCTRKLVGVTGVDKIYRDYENNGGRFGSYYYRKEIYAYYDIKTSEFVF